MKIEAHNIKRGIKTAVEELHSQNLPIVENQEQISFLPELPLDGALAKQGNVPAKTGAGRPPGAKNKSTEALKNYLLTRYRNPVEGLMQTYSMSLEALAEVFGVKKEEFTKLSLAEKMDLFKLQLMCMKEAAPYVAQKMPIAVDAGQNGLIQLVINQGNAVAQVGNDAIPQAIKILNSQDEENQLVTDADFTDSNDSESNENG